MRRMPAILAAVLLAIGTVVSAVPAGGDAKKTSPTLILDVSGRLVDAVVAKPIDRAELDYDEYDGTPTISNVRTTGNLRAELQPNANAGVVELIVSGRNDANDIGTRCFVLVYTRSLIPFEARQRIVLTPQSIRGVPGPRWANAFLTLTGTTNKEGDSEALSAMLARAGFCQNKERLEGIVSRKVAAKVALRFEADLTDPLTKASKTIGAAMKKLKEFGLTDANLSFTTTATHLQVRFGASLPDFPPPPAPPPFPSRADLAVRVHEALLNETARLALGGKTFGLTEVRGRVDELTENLLRDGPGDKEREDLLRTVDKVLKSLTMETPRFTFAAEDPVTVHFVEDGFTVEAHIDSFLLGKKTIRGIRVGAAYRIENTAGEVAAVRVGPVRVIAEEEKVKKKSILAKTERLLLDASAASVFRGKLTLIDKLPSAVPGIARIEPMSAVSNAGWLTLSWTLPAK